MPVSKELNRKIHASTIPRVISGVIVPMIQEAQEVVGEAPSWWKGKGMAGFLRKKHRILRSKTTQEVTIASLWLQTRIQSDDSTCIVSYSRVGHLQLILSHKYIHRY